MAYKAVRLAPGFNTVHWRFGSRIASFLLALFAIQSLGWLIFSAWLFVLILCQKEPIEKMLSPPGETIIASIGRGRVVGKIRRAIIDPKFRS